MYRLCSIWTHEVGEILGQAPLGANGDPLDLMILLDAPAHVGCPMDERIIGITEVKQTEDG